MQIKRALSYYLESKLIHFIENLQVERKLRLCQEFLDVFGRVDPGQATDWWAVTQLEAIGAKSVLLQRDLESGKIPASAFKEALIGRVKSVVKFPLFFEFKIQFTGCTRLMGILLERISLLRFFKTFQKQRRRRWGGRGGMCPPHLFGRCGISEFFVKLKYLALIISSEL